MFLSPFSLIKSANWRDLGQKLLLVLLLPAFFILKGYDDNAGLISLSHLPEFILEYCVLPVCIFCVSLFLLGRINKAAIFSISLTVVYLFFGAFHDFIKRQFHQGVLTSYTFLLPVLLLTIIVLFFGLRRMSSSGKKVITYYVWLMGIVVSIQVISLVYHLFTYRSANDLSGDPVMTSQVDSCTESPKPDIFFVVLDGYTSSSCLREEFKYSNGSMDSLLRKNKFFISTRSMSNYNVTPFSLSSTLDMNYLKAGIENKPISSRVFLRAMETLKNNETIKFFKEQGYLVKNYGCFDFTGASLDRKPYFNDAPFNQLNNQTLWSRIRKDIGWNFTTENFFSGAFRVPAGYLEAKTYHLERNQYNWTKLISELGQTIDTPRLIFVHVMLPHEPFYLNRDGSMASDTAIIQQTNNLKEGYLNQLVYVNSLLKELIPLVAAPGQRERVMILEGDHGFRDYGNAAKRDQEFMNLNAYYFPDRDYRMLYDSISPVNSFRVILNKYFCQDLPLLKDSTVYLINNTQYN